MEQQAGLSLDCARLSWLMYTGRKMVEIKKIFVWLLQRMSMLHVFLLYLPSK